MQTVTVGYQRDDGDFAVIATLNNNDKHMDDKVFMDIVHNLADKLCREMVCQIDVLYRQDAPDYINTED
jgi:hypothetical protein